MRTSGRIPRRHDRARRPGASRTIIDMAAGAGLALLLVALAALVLGAL
jgi:hypothetical protein